MFARLLILPVLLFASACASAVPGHYLVFAIDSKQRVTPQFHASVELAGVPDIRSPSEVLPGERLPGRETVVHVRAQRGKRAAPEFSSTMALSLRSERVQASGDLEGRVLAADSLAFAVRVPHGIETLYVDVGLGEQKFDVAQLVAEAKSLPLGDFEISGSRVKTAVGNPANRIDVLFLGDGFTHDEEALFHDRVEEVEEGLFSVSPFREYRGAINVASLYVPSPDSGADHPPYRSDCTDATCCADQDALADPEAGRFRNTAFDATFCAAQLHRLLVVNQSKVLAAAAQMPDWDTIMVLVNDSTYGGSGGLIAVLSTHESAVLLAAHEWSHSFSGLGDEYVIDGVEKYCSDEVWTQCPANITDLTDPLTIKWRKWFTPGIAIPTPGTSPGLGLFEGAGAAKGLYRPSNSCLMRNLRVDRFCDVCSEQFVTRLYQGGFGVPSAGIDTIEPGSESPPIDRFVQYQPGATMRFSAELLPVDGLQAAWFLDGIPIEGAHGGAMDLVLDAPAYSKHLLQLRVTDRGPFSTPAHDGLLSTGTRTWKIRVSRTVVEKNRLAASEHPWSGKVPPTCASRENEKASTDAR